ncbi:hypothetical protein [Streptomyces sp. NPDC016172]|uniref:hypothetical protein n=1 Tax=Streptomyces sp. NPDC016172 TaxID=3364964 RepID=UPI0036FDCD28
MPHAWTAFVVLSALQVPLVAALGETAWQGLNSAVSHVVGGPALFGVVRLADLAVETAGGPDRTGAAGGRP